MARLVARLLTAAGLAAALLSADILPAAAQAAQQERR